MSGRGHFMAERVTASRRLSLFVEYLEVRSLLSATDLAGFVASPQAIEPAAANHSTPVGLTPAQIASDYGFNQVSLPSGQLAGAGQTIAIIDAYDDPNIKNDLSVFDTTFGLPTANLTVAKEYINGIPPTVNSGWAAEISLDVEWAHAMAPGANILLVETSDASLNNLLLGIDYARQQPNVSVISMSWGGSEFSSETAYDSTFTTPAGHVPITFVASAGDDGAGAIWPAVSANVLGVGGTTLNQSGGVYQSESAWSDSGGGTSSFVNEPSYQLSSQTTGRRTTPDVAFDADPNTGIAVYDSLPESGQSGWLEFGGTSAGAPQWSALISIVNQDRVAAGKSTLSNTPAAIYSLPGSDFHDITSGPRATVGYDQVTGRGTPIANLVVQGLAGSTAVTNAATTSSFLSQAGLLTSGSRNLVMDDPAGVVISVDSPVVGTQNANFGPPAIGTAGQELSTAAAASSQSAKVAAALQSTSAAAGPLFSAHGWLPLLDATAPDDAAGPDVAAAAMVGYGLRGRDAAGAIAGSTAAADERGSLAAPLERGAVDACFADCGLNVDVSSDVSEPLPAKADEDATIDARLDDGQVSNLPGLAALALVSVGSWKLERTKDNRRIIHSRHGFELLID